MLHSTQASQAPPRPGLAGCPLSHNQQEAKPHPGSTQTDSSLKQQTDRKKKKEKKKKRKTDRHWAPPQQLLCAHGVPTLPSGPLRHTLWPGGGLAPPSLQRLEDSSPHGMRRGLRYPWTLNCSLLPTPGAVHQRQGESYVVYLPGMAFLQGAPSQVLGRTGSSGRHVPQFQEVRIQGIPRGSKVDQGLEMCRTV